MSHAHATLTGPLPGTDTAAAVHHVLTELAAPHLPVVPELPARGVTSQVTARAIALLTELPVDLQPYGWRLTPPSATLSSSARQARSWIGEDLARIADHAGHHNMDLPRLAIRVLGPVSLAARLWLPGGERALRDHGARRDITQSYAAGLVELAHRITASTGAQPVIMLDEPDAEAVLTGQIATASGYQTVRSVDRHELRDHWAHTLNLLTTPARLAHPAPSVFVAPTLRQELLDLLIPLLPAPDVSETADGEPAPAHGLILPAIDLDVAPQGPMVWENAAALAEAGHGVQLTLPLHDFGSGVDPARVAQRFQQLWEDRLGMDPQLLTRMRFAVADLSGLTLSDAARTLHQVRECADRLNEPL